VQPFKTCRQESIANAG